MRGLAEIRHVGTVIANKGYLMKMTKKSYRQTIENLAQGVCRLV
jgi:hypothetical protein